MIGELNVLRARGACRDSALLGHWMWRSGVSSLGLMATIGWGAGAAAQTAVTLPPVVIEALKEAHAKPKAIPPATTQSAPRPAEAKPLPAQATAPAVAPIDPAVTAATRSPPSPDAIRGAHRWLPSLALRVDFALWSAEHLSARDVKERAG